jgi:D-galacturonate reductase
VFTPDDTHYEIALYGIRKGLHVMLTKPPVKTLKEVRLFLSLSLSVCVW